MTEKLSPLISRETYEELQALRRHLIAGPDPCASPPFVAVGPTPSTTSGPRILFVGQSARLEETDGADFDEAVAWTREQLVDTWCHYPFWDFMRQAVGSVLRVEFNESLRPHLGWTNVAKIGTGAKGNGNPGESSILEQVDLCSRALREEIQTAAPHAIILVSGPYFGRPIVDAVFDTGSWTDWIVSGNAWFRTRSSPLRPVFWTYHPSYLRRRRSEADAARDIANWGSSQSIPPVA